MDAERKYSAQFDDWSPKSFELTADQIAAAIAPLPLQVIEDTEFCQANVRSFAQAQFETLRPLELETRRGVILGHEHIPVERVGSYIPGGRYPMFGSAQMSIIPAKVAGVKSVIACTPSVKGEGYFPATINAMQKAGADRIFIISRVPAMAMMAFGLGDVAAVDILCGAGNKYVAEAKRQLFGRCGIDLLAGPTEILVIADDSADPALVGCDLLGQCAKFLVDERQKLLGSGGIALFNLRQDLGDVTHDVDCTIRAGGRNVPSDRRPSLIRRWNAYVTSDETSCVTKANRSDLPTSLGHIDRGVGPTQFQGSFDHS